MKTSSKLIFILETIDISPSMLASILGVNHNTYRAWLDNERQDDKRLKRVEKLYLFCKAADSCCIESNQMLNLLNEPLFGEDTESWLDLIFKE